MTSTKAPARKPAGAAASAGGQFTTKTRTDGDAKLEHPAWPLTELKPGYQAFAGYPETGPWPSIIAKRDEDGRLTVTAQGPIFDLTDFAEANGIPHKDQAGWVAHNIVLIQDAMRQNLPSRASVVLVGDTLGRVHYHLTRPGEPEPETLTDAVNQIKALDLTSKFDRPGAEPCEYLSEAIAAYATLDEDYEAELSGIRAIAHRI